MPKKIRLKSNYRKGYLKELEVIRILKRKKRFQTVFRAAGSHSPFDVIAISRSKILLLQVKSGKFSLKKELKKLRGIKVPNCVEKQLWIVQKDWKIIGC
jgi:Holliday junction resolvase